MLAIPSHDGVAIHIGGVSVLDLISMPFEFSESTVLMALGLGVVVAIGLIIREKLQGSERGISR